MSEDSYFKILSLPLPLPTFPISLPLPSSPLRGYGGWVAPNIYYLGNAGVVRYGGLRIAGISGIYNDKHYRSSKTRKTGYHNYRKVTYFLVLDRFETPPYNPGSMRSTYHVRSCDVFRLKQVSHALIENLENLRY